MGRWRNCMPVTPMPVSVRAARSSTSSCVNDVAPTFAHGVSLSSPQGGGACLGRPGAARALATLSPTLPQPLSPGGREGSSTATFCYFASARALRSSRCTYLHCVPMKPFLRQQLARYADRLGELEFLLSREDIM